MLVEAQPTAKRTRVPSWILISVVIFVVAVVGALIFVLANWPFKRDNVAKALGQTFASTVDIKQFHNTYFPPGCVAEGIAFRDGRSLGTIGKLTIEANWATLLAMQKRIETIRAEGLFVRVLPHGQSANGAKPDDGGSSNSKLVVGRITADGAVLEVDRTDQSKPPLRFEIHQLTLNNVGRGRAMSYRAALRNPEPPGEITSTGQFGPFNMDDHGKTPLSGSYSFEHADLGLFHLVAGTLSSKGTFKGILERIEVHGSTAIPDFEAKSSGHPVNLTTQFHAFVKGTNGDVLLDPADSHIEQTGIISTGGIVGMQGQKGKTVSLEMTVRQGYIQDLMRLLMKSPRPPMVGVIGFQAKAVVPPSGGKFLERLNLTGDFGIGDARFTNPKTRKNIDVLSERARGDKNDDNDPQNVISNLKGHVVVRNGVAQFSNLTFGVPGALAQLDGTFNLLDQRIDLHGDLTMQADLSDATKGVKSFLLKAVDPFFKNKKRNAGAVVPIHIGGTYSHPSYGLDITGKKEHRIERRLKAGVN